MKPLIVTEGRRETAILRRVFRGKRYRYYTSTTRYSLKAAKRLLKEGKGPLLLVFRDQSGNDDRLSYVRRELGEEGDFDGTSHSLVYGMLETGILDSYDVHFPKGYYPTESEIDRAIQDRFGIAFEDFAAQLDSGEVETLRQIGVIQDIREKLVELEECDEQA